MSIIDNSIRPKSTLNKKSNSICYYAVQSVVVMGQALLAHVPTKSNLADLFTKLLNGVSWCNLVDKMLYYICN